MGKKKSKVRIDSTIQSRSNIKNLEEEIKKMIIAKIIRFVVPRFILA